MVTDVASCVSAGTKEAMMRASTIEIKLYFEESASGCESCETATIDGDIHRMKVTWCVAYVWYYYLQAC